MANLKTITLASTIGLIGCMNDFSGYHFKGSLSLDGISSEHVELTEGICGLVLKIEKGEGKTVYFIDYDKDKVVDVVRLEYKGLLINTMKDYNSRDKVGKAVLRMAQPEFDTYWNAIGALNIQEAKAVLSD